MKAAIIILSDPKTGTEEALGRVFNALAAAYYFQAKGVKVNILFQGAGTRWVGELSHPKHPAYGLYNAVKDNVQGVSCGCAAVFGATEAAEKAGLDLIKNNPVPGTPGLPSLHQLMQDGYSVMIF